MICYDKLLEGMRAPGRTGLETRAYQKVDPQPELVKLLLLNVSVFKLKHGTRSGRGFYVGKNLYPNASWRKFCGLKPAVFGDVQGPALGETFCETAVVSEPSACNFGNSEPKNANVVYACFLFSFSSL